MWEKRFSEDPEHDAWWRAFQGFIRNFFNKTRDQTNNYFRKSHPEEPPMKKWFPRPAKMHPPRPDEDIPPLTVTVNRRTVSSPGPSGNVAIDHLDHHVPPPLGGVTATKTPPSRQLGIPMGPGTCNGGVQTRWSCLHATV